VRDHVRGLIRSASSNCSGLCRITGVERGRTGSQRLLQARRRSWRRLQVRVGCTQLASAMLFASLPRHRRPPACAALVSIAPAPHRAPEPPETPRRWAATRRSPLRLRQLPQLVPRRRPAARLAGALPVRDALRRPIAAALRRRTRLRVREMRSRYDQAAPESCERSCPVSAPRQADATAGHRRPSGGCNVTRRRTAVTGRTPAAAPAVRRRRRHLERPILRLLGGNEDECSSGQEWRRGECRRRLATHTLSSHR
jgi:hypothetical protein